MFFCPLCHNELDGGEDIVYGEEVCRTCYEKHRLEDNWANKYSGRHSDKKANKKTKRKTDRKGLHRRLQTRLRTGGGRGKLKGSYPSLYDRGRTPRD